jgi:vacuolar-type H+-ATPase subunit I/STV1
LLERVVQLRRGKAAEAEAEAPADEGVKTEAGYAEQIKALEQRIAHLEAIVEGLQDAFHREAVRRGKQIEGLEAKTEPDEITRALSRDARERGI